MFPRFHVYILQTLKNLLLNYNIAYKYVLTGGPGKGKTISNSIELKDKIFYRCLDVKNNKYFCLEKYIQR